MIEWIAYFTAYFLAGFTLKMGDDLLDVLDRPGMSWFPLAFSGLFFGLLMTVTEYDLALLVSIIIGVLASGKVNRPQFVIGFVVIAGVIIILGLPPITAWLDFLTLVIMMFLAAVLDEKGNDWANPEISPRAYKFFQYRFTLKVSVILMSIPWPLLFPAAIGLLFFDTGYEIVGWKTKRIQNNS